MSEMTRPGQERNEFRTCFENLINKLLHLYPKSDPALMRSWCPEVNFGLSQLPGQVI
jgi:hypothetical protein